MGEEQTNIGPHNFKVLRPWTLEFLDAGVSKLGEAHKEWSQAVIHTEFSYQEIPVQLKLYV